MLRSAAGNASVVRRAAALSARRREKEKESGSRLESEKTHPSAAAVTASQHSTPLSQPISTPCARRRRGDELGRCARAKWRRAEKMR